MAQQLSKDTVATAIAALEDMIEGYEFSGYSEKDMDEAKAALTADLRKLQQADSAAAPQPVAMPVEVRREADDKYIVLMTPERIAALWYALELAEVGVGHDQYDPNLQVIKELLAELGALKQRRPGQE